MGTLIGVDFGSNWRWKESLELRMFLIPLFQLYQTLTY